MLTFPCNSYSFYHWIWLTYNSNFWLSIRIDIIIKKKKNNLTFKSEVVEQWKYLCTLQIKSWRREKQIKIVKKVDKRRRTIDEHQRSRRSHGGDGVAHLALVNPRRISWTGKGEKRRRTKLKTVVMGLEIFLQPVFGLISHVFSGSWALCFWNYFKIILNIY